MHKVYLNLEKGGSGRTLTLYHLAWTLGDLFNKRVLVVDLDAQKNISFLFRIDGDTNVKEGGCSIAHVLFENANADGKRRSIKDCIIKDVAPNVDIAYSSSEMSDAEAYILNNIMNPRRMYKWDTLLLDALKEVEDEYDYVFFDTDGTYNRLFVNSVVATDLIIPTMRTDFQNLQCFVNTIDNLKSLIEIDFTSKIGGILCTSYENTTQSNKCIKSVQNNGYDIWGVIKKQVAMQDSAMYKMPIYKYSPTNQGAWGIIRFAHKILEYFNEDFSVQLDNKYRRKKDF